MSTMTITASNSGLSKVSDFQGFSANPSGRIVLNRRGRLARTLVVLSLAIVAASLAGGQAGATTSAKATSSQVSAAHSFITVTVAPGDTVWSLANRVTTDGNASDLVASIIEINSLGNGDLTAGQKIRIPLAG